MSKTKHARTQAGKQTDLHIPGLNFGERQALRHYAKQAGMSPADLVREAVRESAWEIAFLTATPSTGRPKSKKLVKRRPFTSPSFEACLKPA